MAGKKKEIVRQIDAASAECQTALGRVADSIINLPPGDGRTYRDELIYCDRTVDPALTELITGINNLERALGNLKKYIKDTKWNLFKKASRETAIEHQTTAEGFLRQLRTDIAEFHRQLSERQLDVLTRASKSTAGLFRDLLGDD